jgi:hypothetical protein
MSEEPTCKVCGYDYVLGLPEDEERHSRFHDEVDKGPLADMNDGVYIVSLNDPQPLQRMAEQAFRLGKREAHYDFDLFTVGEHTSDDPISTVRVRGGRAIAGVLTRVRSCQQKADLSNFKRSTLDRLWRPSGREKIELHDRRAIEFIWVHRKHRGQEILDLCLDEIQRHCGLPLPEFSHSLPFTEAALKFWRKRSLGNTYIAHSDLPVDCPYRDAHNDAIDQLLKGPVESCQT